jgi:hypothetical protein
MPNEGEDLIIPQKWYENLPRKSWDRFERIETSHTWFEVYELPHSVYAIARASLSTIIISRGKMQRRA